MSILETPRIQHFTYILVKAYLFIQEKLHHISEINYPLMLEVVDLSCGREEGRKEGRESGSGKGGREGGEKGDEVSCLCNT